MIKIIDKTKCMGCNACYSVCPVNCISMVPDDEGFNYPKVNKERCINCEACVKVCPILNIKPISTDIEQEKPIVFAAYNKDDNVRSKSSSGGVFYLFAEYILENKGVVFGASFDSNNMVKHIKVESIKDLPLLMTSKYVQSDIGDTYKEALKYLKEKRMVLFTGTPCQIAGLNHYLKRSYDNLYTQDIICHGVPSPKLWKKYLNSLGTEKIKNINFRSKETGWNRYSFEYTSNGKKSINEHNKNVYMKSFLSNYNLRPSCYACKFKHANDKSDITLGDFWGAEKSDLHINKKNDKGLSLIFINSSKGKDLLNLVSNKLAMEEIDFDQAVKYNPSYSSGLNKPEKRDIFFTDIDSGDFDEVVKKYTKLSCKCRLKNFAKKILRKCHLC